MRSSEIRTVARRTYVVNCDACGGELGASDADPVFVDGRHAILCFYNGSARLSAYEFCADCGTKMLGTVGLKPKIVEAA